MANTHELIIAAEEAAFDLPDEGEERFNTLQEQLNGSPWLEEVETDLYTREMLPQIAVSEAVAAQCAEEMAQGARTGWSIR